MIHRNLPINCIRKLSNSVIGNAYNRLLVLGILQNVKNEVIFVHQKKSMNIRKNGRNGWEISKKYITTEEMKNGKS